jgi:hypothetical protein
LRFAVAVSTTGVNIHAVGVIIMIVAAVGFVLSLAFWSSWGGFGGFGGGYRRERMTMHDPSTGVTTSRDKTLY